MKNKMSVLVLVCLLSVVTTVGAFASTKKASLSATPITAVEQTKENENEKEQDLTNVTVALTEEAAKQIAIDSVANATFVKIELEDENGVIVYGVELSLDNKEIDVKVDANSGQILASEQDQNEKDSQSNKQDNDQVEHENESEDSEGYQD